MGAIKARDFGTTSDGEHFSLYTLTNERGMSSGITDLGGCIVSLCVPDKDGRPVDIELGYDSAAGYAVSRPNLGAPIGRHANQIGGASFVLDGKRYELEPNDHEVNNLCEPKPLGLGLSSGDPAIKAADGYDHNYALRPGVPTAADEGFVGALRHVARVRGDKTGIVMDVATDLPGMQLYTGNHVGGEQGKGGNVTVDHGAFCLETQFFPDAVNHPSLPNPSLGPRSPIAAARSTRSAWRRKAAARSQSPPPGMKWGPFDTPNHPERRTLSSNHPEKRIMRGPERA